MAPKERKLDMARFSLQLPGLPLRSTLKKLPTDWIGLKKVNQLADC